MKNELVKRGADPKRTRSIPQSSPAPIRAFNSQITCNTSNKLRRAIQTKSTSGKGAVMCDFRWGANPGLGLSFAVGCCGAPFESLLRTVSFREVRNGDDITLRRALFAKNTSHDKAVEWLFASRSRSPSQSCS